MSRVLIVISTLVLYCTLTNCQRSTSIQGRYVRPSAVLNKDERPRDRFDEERDVVKDFDTSRDRLDDERDVKDFDTSRDRHDEVKFVVRDRDTSKDRLDDERDVVKDRDTSRDRHDEHKFVVRDRDTSRDRLDDERDVVKDRDASRDRLDDERDVVKDSDASRDRYDEDKFVDRDRDTHRDRYGDAKYVEDSRPKETRRPQDDGYRSGVYGARPRDDYNTKPEIIADYRPEPLDKDKSRPESREEGSVYGAKPRDQYNPKPKDPEYGPLDKNDKPREDERGYRVIPGGGPTRDDYIPKPKDVYEPPEDYRPDHRDTKPAISSSYKPSGDFKQDDDRDYPKHYPDDPIKDDDGLSDYKDDDAVGKDSLEGGDCICVPYYQCKDGHIVTDGAGIIDARRRKEPDESLKEMKPKPRPCGVIHVCCSAPEASTVKPFEHRCGVRHPSGINSRILSPSNKGEAEFGEWPWQAAVLKTEGSVYIFQCGGVLIDKYHVLTVAHCVFHLSKYNDFPLKIRLGEWDTQTVTEFLAHEDYKVTKITIHPEYRNSSLWNDIAILRLEQPVLFAPHIDTVCLPKHDDNFAGKNCIVTGWGKDSYKGGMFSNVMKEIALQVVDTYSCEEMLRKTRLGRFYQLHEGFVCAGGENGLDSCKGDGGGPLVCQKKDRSYALAGLVSWGIDCGQPGVPGVYVKIQRYLDWISKVTGSPLQDYWPDH